MKIIDKIGRCFINALIVLIMITAAFTLYSFIALEVMKKDYVSVLGYTYFEVASGSMSPTIKKNDMIIVKLGSDYKQEDIITYGLDGDFITHRVKRVDANNVITKGDANNTKDSPVSKDSVLGRVVLIIPQAGIWKRIFMTPKVLILLMITFTLFSITFSYNPKSKREKIKIQSERHEKRNSYELPIIVKDNEIKKNSCELPLLAKNNEIKKLPLLTKNRQLKRRSRELPLLAKNNEIKKDNSDIKKDKGD